MPTKPNQSDDRRRDGAEHGLPPENRSEVGGTSATLSKTGDTTSEEKADIYFHEWRDAMAPNPIHNQLLVGAAVVILSVTGFLYHRLLSDAPAEPATASERAKVVEQDLEKNKSLQIKFKAVRNFLAMKFMQMSQFNNFQASARQDFDHITEGNEHLARRTEAGLLEEIQVYKAYWLGDLSTFRSLLTTVKTADGYDVRGVVKDFVDTLPDKSSQNPVDFVYGLAEKLKAKHPAMDIDPKSESQEVEDTADYYQEVTSQIKQMANKLAGSYSIDSDSLNHKVLARLIERELIEEVEDQEILDYLQLRYDSESKEAIRSLSQGIGISFEVNTIDNVNYRFENDEIISIAEAPEVTTPERPSEESDLVVLLADTWLNENNAALSPEQIIGLEFGSTEYDEKIAELYKSYADIFVVFIRTALLSEQLKALTDMDAELQRRARKE